MTDRLSRNLGLLAALAVVMALAAGQAIAGEITTSVSFSPSDLIFEAVEGYDVVKLADCDITREIGEPQLPAKLFYVALPAGAEIDHVELLSTDSEELEGSYHLLPVQPPRPYGDPRTATRDVPMVRPKTAVYGSSVLYPANIVEAGQAGTMSGYRLAGLSFYPIQYQPSEGALLFHRRIDFRVHYTTGKGAHDILKGRSDSVDSVLRQKMREVVLNPDDVGERVGLEGHVISLVPAGYYEYVIITSEAFAAHFQPLAEWKTKKGVPATIVTTAWIYANYGGIDNQEMIRNFIKDAYLNWGTMWVLLGGDCSDKTDVNQPGPTGSRVLPARSAYAMDFEWDASQYDENDLQADLYYSDLDGTWNDNGNGVFGEVADGVDLYPDVFVGRAPVHSEEEVATFVNKVLSYERPVQTETLMKMLFLGEIMWDVPYTDGGEGKNMIDEECIPERFDPITKLYQSKGNENTQSVVAAFNEGYHIINHDGHCWWTVMGVGNGYLYSSHMDDLTNDPAYGIIYSIGCWPAAFDYDCIAEHYVVNPHGGGVAFIGNSRYGWGAPGNPGWGYSDRIDHRFLHNLFVEDTYHLGAAFDLAKAYYIAASQQANVYRIHQYEVNLLGDPELPVWTDAPVELVVSHPTRVTIGANQITVTVRTGAGAVQGALVCLQKGSDVYAFGRTDAQGHVALSVSPASSGSMNITVTGHNVLPYEGTITVIGSGARVSHGTYTISENSGNGDALVSPGETISLGVSFVNQGNQAAGNVTVTLTAMDELVTVIDGQKDCGNMAAGAEVPGASDDFSFSVSAEATNGQVLFLAFNMRDGSGNHWESTLGLPVCTPAVAYASHTLNDAQGNDNGYAEPGETVALVVTFANNGLASARGATVSISSGDPYLTVSENPVILGDIDPGSSGQGTFSVAISEDCPGTHFPIVSLSLGTQDGYSFTDHCLLSIGSMGFDDDMENGQGSWTHNGTRDMWHLSSYRFNSGTQSWYCGDEGTREYVMDMDCSLISPSFGLGPNTQLTFWLWFEVATYGIVGVYVEVNTGNDWQKIDFLGSGGALGQNGQREVPSDWLQYTYDLSSFPVGQAQIRFRFHSEAMSLWHGDYIWEGVYIDDVVIAPSGTADIGSCQPEITSTAFAIDDTQGDGDGIVDAGEQCRLTLNLQNTGLREAQNMMLMLSADDPDVVVTDGQAFVSAIPVGTTLVLSADDFSFETEPDAPLHVIPFIVHLVEDDAYYQTEMTFHVRMGQGKVLVVGDDAGAGNASLYEDALDAVHVQRDGWNVQANGLPSIEVLEQYDDVIWLTAASQPALSGEEMSALQSFLDDGGNLLLSGNMIGFSNGQTSFFSDYLHAHYVYFMTRLHHLNAVEGNSVVPESAISLAQNGATSQTFTGEIDPLPPAFSIYTYDRTTSEGPGDIRSSGSGGIAFGSETYKAVYLSFGFEGIEPAQARQDIVDGILNWFRTEIVIGNGDVIEDGVVNVLDVVRTVNIILGSYQPSEGELARADTNGDGRVNVIDVVGIVNIILYGDTAAKGASPEQGKGAERLQTGE